MPHLLHHLGVDANAKALDTNTNTAVSKSRGQGASPLITGECMDWGTLAVYTCPDSCASKPELSKIGVEDGKGEDPPVVGYVEEFVWRQPPP